MPDNSHGLWQGEQQPTEMNADALWSRPYIYEPTGKRKVLVHEGKVEGFVSQGPGTMKNLSILDPLKFFTYIYT